MADNVDNMENEEKTKTTFYIDKKVLKEIKFRCVIEEISQSEFIRTAINDALKKPIKTEKGLNKVLDSYMEIESKKEIS